MGLIESTLCLLANTSSARERQFWLFDLLARVSGCELVVYLQLYTSGGGPNFQLLNEFVHPTQLGEHLLCVVLSYSFTELNSKQLANYIQLLVRVYLMAHFTRAHISQRRGDEHRAKLNQTPAPFILCTSSYTISSYVPIGPLFHLGPARAGFTHLNRSGS